MKNNKAVTLVALIITVIILLILAGVVIAMTIGDEGIINKSQQAVEKYNEATVREKVTIMLAEYAMERTNSTKTLEEYLNEQKAKGELDKVKNNKNGTITVEVDGYELTIIESNLSIMSAGEINPNLINGYVKDGLILYLDGIDKKGDTNSEDTSGKWYDLSDSQNNAELYNCIESDNNIEFNGSSSYAKLPARALGDYGPSTIEVVLKAENKSAIIGDNSLISHRGLGINDNDKLSAWIGRDGAEGTYYYSTTLDLYSKQHTYALLYDGVSYNNTNAYIDMQKAIKTSNHGGFSNTSAYPIVGKRIWSGATSWPLKGNIYAIRVYNRQLTQDELTQNYNMDKKRFGF